MHTFGSTFIKKIKSLPATILLRQGYCWIGKNTNKEFNCVMILMIIRPRTKLFTIPFFWPYYIISIFVMWTFDFTSQIIFNKSISYPRIKKLWSKATKYIRKCRERSLKRKGNLNFLRVINNLSFDHHFAYIWSKPF